MAPTSIALSGGFMRHLLYSFLALWLIATVVAQTGIDGAILGVVTDANGGAVSGATVVVINVDTGVQKTAITSADGSFEVLPLPEGYYSVSVSYKGFKTWTLPRVQV